MSTDGIRNTPTQRLDDPSAIAHAQRFNTMINLRRASFGSALERAGRTRATLADVEDDLKQVAGSFGSLSVSSPDKPVDSIAASPQTRDEPWRSASDLWASYAAPDLTQPTPAATPPAPSGLAAIRSTIPGLNSSIEIAPRGAPQTASAPTAEPAQTASPSAEAVDIPDAPPANSYIRPFTLGDIDFS